MLLDNSQIRFLTIFRDINTRAAFVNDIHVISYLSLIYKNLARLTNFVSQPVNNFLNQWTLKAEEIWHSELQVGCQMLLLLCSPFFRVKLDDFSHFN